VRISDTYSLRDEELLLRQRGALEACHDVVRRWSDSAEVKAQLLHGSRFKAEWRFDAGGNNPRFDAYCQRWKVGIEREMRQQMNVRSHLLLTEVAFRTGLIDVAVFILRMDGQARFRRIVNEVSKYDLFTKYFPLQMPLYLIDCEPN